MTMHETTTQFLIQADIGGHVATVAIGSLLNGTSSGGLRIAEDLDLEEIRTLAWEMTLKFSFIGLPRGGGKSGLKLLPGTTPEEKRAVLEELGRRMAPVIRSGIYYPGMDMNCGPDDLRALYRGAGFTLGETMTDTSYFTAISVDNAIQACVAELPLTGRPLTVAIEGYGSVGNYLAQRLQPEQFRIVTLSTARGAVACDTGFQPELLSQARSLHGDELVHHLSGARVVTKEEVLAADVDILVPAARTWSIHAGNMAKIRARVVVPAANAPCTAQSSAFLQERNIFCLPGFVTNCGGVYASSLYDSGVGKEKIEEISARYYRSVVAALVRKSRELGISPVVLAERVALARLREKQSTQGSPGRVAKIMKRLFSKGMLPRSVHGRRIAAGFVENLCLLEAQIRDERVC